MLFKNLRKLQEVEEEEDDFSYEVDEEEDEETEYANEEIKSTIEELTLAVSSMKDLVRSVMEEKTDTAGKDAEAITKVTEIYRSHLKINWNEANTQDVLPTLRSFETIQTRLKEINYSFVHLEISEFRYELLRNILVSKLVYLIRRILFRVY